MKRSENLITIPLRTASLLLAISLLAGCNSYIPKGQVNGPSVEQEDLPDFKTIQTQILQPYCLSCHGTPGAVDLTTYQGVKAAAPLIYQDVVVNRTMPMGQSLPGNLRQMLATWINNGAPQTVSARDFRELNPTNN